MQGKVSIHLPPAELLLGVFYNPRTGSNYLIWNISPKPTTDRR